MNYSVSVSNLSCAQGKLLSVWAHDWYWISFDATSHRLLVLVKRITGNREVEKVSWSRVVIVVRGADSGIELHIHWTGQCSLKGLIEMYVPKARFCDPNDLAGDCRRRYYRCCCEFHRQAARITKKQKPRLFDWPE